MAGRMMGLNFKEMILPFIILPQIHFVIGCEMRR